MTHRSWSVIAAACALPMLLAACSKDEKKIPSAPVTPAMSGSVDRDAGSIADEDEDAGKMDAGSAITLCTRLAGAKGSMDTSEIGTWVETPGDFVLTRQVERWSSDCSKPRLILEFSDGVCPLGSGHTVTFSFSYQDVMDGVLHAGNNIVGIESETPQISLRYVRPTRLKPHGTWGTCDGASGTLVFLTQPILEPGQYLQARYQLDLTSCETDTTAKTVFLEGAFNVLLRTSRTDACPPTGGAGGIGDTFGAGGFGSFGTGGAGGVSTSSDFL